MARRMQKHGRGKKEPLGKKNTKDPLDMEDTKIICGKCMAVNPAGNKYCNKCGNPLSLERR
ncbi:MAG: zinc ribbon domain-containing protein [Candidatus Woesearchaeota archaeon]|nr:zinc ribbon domain-containing protein [Candidatus Woesearchaeota archaeon]